MKEHRKLFGKIELTPMMIRYLIKLLFRCGVFTAFLVMYIIDKERLCSLMTHPIRCGINALNVMWFGFMSIMLLHIFPTNRLTMALRKAKQKHYKPVKYCSETEILRNVQKQNISAWKVMLVWLIFNSIFGILYLFDIIDNADLLMLTVFYFLCDYICIMFFCPFQSFIMKNKCCVNCRIYDWGHFMMFTPMLFIRNFYSWSLFFTSCVVLIHWEIIYSRHPERFWSGSNKTLQCSECKDKTCQIKKCLKGDL